MNDAPEPVDTLFPPGLLVDLYELTMMQAYWRHGIDGTATFDLFVRGLPDERNFLLVAGLATVLEHLERVRFTADDLSYLDSTAMFDPEFLKTLGSFAFSGDVDAMPEGTVAFAGEPILSVTAPIAEAQFFETLVMNQLHLQTLLASKAARVVLAAGGRGLVDFGLRRMHGVDAGVAGARSCWIAGFDATSNVVAGKLFGIPIAGTMAHSFVQCHATERDAFRAFLEVFPDTILLVDTYDTLRGVDTVIDLAEELGEGFRARGIRLDSGDVAALATEARRRLDAAGLKQLKIFASGNLDEYRIEELVDSGAPIDAFGVGTRLGTSQDAPNLDIVYKLAQLGDRPLLKLSTDKATLPGRKQVWRQRDRDGLMERDVIGLADEVAGDSLLVPVMRSGRRLEAGRGNLVTARHRAAEQLRRLPAGARSLRPMSAPYPVEISDRLRRLREVVARSVGG